MSERHVQLTRRLLEAYNPRATPRPLSPSWTAARIYRDRDEALTELGVSEAELDLIPP
jgi:hypothetical protein